MPPGPTVPIQSVVDAAVMAGSHASLECHGDLEHLPRLIEAGALPGTFVDAALEFQSVDSRTAVVGSLRGSFVLTCQRCLTPSRLSIDQPVSAVLVAAEADVEKDFGVFEPVQCDVHRFDVRWFIEEQLLLELPLVAMHEPDECPAPVGGDKAEESAESKAGRQRPFENLRDLLKS